MRYRYSFSSYDEHLCLKPPLLLWIVLLYLSRAVVLPLVLGAVSLLAINADTADLLRTLFSVYALPPSLIAGVVLYALMRRSPSASGPVRWIWTRGQIFLSAAAALDCTLTLMHSPLRRGELGDQAGTSLVAAAIDLYFLLYVLAARQARDAFADFPAPAQRTKEPSTTAITDVDTAPSVGTVPPAAHQ